jgi:hypothetical protein
MLPRAMLIQILQVKNSNGKQQEDLKKCVCLELHLHWLFVIYFIAFCLYIIEGEDLWRWQSTNPNGFLAEQK